MPANTIDPGTIACVAGTMSGDIYAIWLVAIGAPITPQVDAALKQISYTLANGIVANIIASIDNTKVLQVSGGVITGASSSSPPLPHAPTHENGGSDEIDVTGLSGLLGDPQTPALHASSHENGGSDEINVAGLSGVLTDPQTPIPTAGVDTVAIHSTIAGEIAAIALKAVPVSGDYLVIEDSAAGNAKKSITLGTLPGGAPALHASTHESGGSDEIDVTGLLGLLGDPQTPILHASTHESGGSDELDLTGMLGLLGTAQTPILHAPSHESGGSDEITIENLITAELTTTYVLNPDGLGGVVWAAPTGGGGLTHPQVMARTCGS